MPPNTLFSHLSLPDLFPYGLFEYLHDGLFLDVGAGSGTLSKRVHQFNPAVEVVMYEPFPNNIALIRKFLAPQLNMTLIPKAVADVSGAGKLYVSAVVQGTEKGWEHMAGYSSAGRLIEDAAKLDAEKIHEVEMCTIDETIDRHVSLMKIDVQGAEMRVLRGALQTIQEYGIDMIYLEFSGEAGVLEWLHKHGYVVFDTEYLLIPHQRVTRKLLKSFKHYRKKNLSNGREAVHGIFKEVDATSVEKYLEWFAETKSSFGRMQTDLFCVHTTFLRAFVEILPIYLSEHAA